MLWPRAACAEFTVNMTPGVTDVSQSVYSLHMTIFWICVVIALVVFGVMFWSIIYHRKSKGAQPHPFHESTLVEIAWTIIPLLILVVMAIPATATLVKMYDTSDADVDIKITGYQWKWRYEYLNQNVSFFSNLSTPDDQIQGKAVKGEHYLLEVDEPLVVPVGKKIRFLLTANDVIHSWWVPALAVKKDAIPGFINEAWTRINEPGIYRGQCAELCGQNHGFMPIVVQAVTPDAYQQWLAERQQKAVQESALKDKTWTRDELMARGEQVYGTNCAACHQPSGEGIPPVFPALKGSSVALGPIENHIHTVLFGKSGTAMQAFGTQLSEVDLAAVITWERNAWGNSTGDAVTPQMIVEAKASASK
ncbi:MAG: cytochrome c oxidase subunit II [Hahellaceae bacterium]|nr:cytochrome c oxidase subunit II [Hahellaceae bacterium]